MSLLLREGLPRTASEVKNNTLNSYFPINTKDRKDIFNWDSALGYVVKASYRSQLKAIDLSRDEKAKVKSGELELSNIAFEKFKSACGIKFKSKLDDSDFWLVLENMYFSNGEIFKVSPEFLLLKTIKQKGSSTDARLGGMFANLIGEYFFRSKPKSELNFIEQQIYDEFMTFVEYENSSKEKVKMEQPYLPFMAEQFQEDLGFLSKKPKYLLSIFKEFLRIYAHLYTAQLALNLKSWRFGEPEAKPCFYILDSEKASEERSYVQEFGYTQLASALRIVFPYLSMNESLQDAKNKGIPYYPLWSLADNFKAHPGCVSRLNEFALAFKESRKLGTKLSFSEDPLVVIEDLLNLAVDQFGPKESRHDINAEYTKATEGEFCSHFIQSRGRAGRVLVINQDYLILLTNLAIGEEPKLRFHELVKAFERRGVFFDKQSQQVLIEFYERIGNVERMSDSGDAVYVRKTI